MIGRRLTAVALWGGLLLLLLSLSLPLYGWAGLRTEGPAIGLLAALTLLITPSPRRRYVAALGAIAGFMACSLIVWRLVTPTTHTSPAVEAILRAARSTTGLGLGLAGAVLVTLVGVLELIGARSASGRAPAERRAGTEALFPSLRGADQRAALTAAWRGLWTSRVLVWTAGILGLLKLGMEPTVTGPAISRPFGSLGNLLAAPASAWDAGSYLSIAQLGYGASTLSSLSIQSRCV